MADVTRRIKTPKWFLGFRRRVSGAELAEALRKFAEQRGNGSQREGKGVYQSGGCFEYTETKFLDSLMCDPCDSHAQDEDALLAIGLMSEHPAKSVEIRTGRMLDNSFIRMDGYYRAVGVGCAEGLYPRGKACAVHLIEGTHEDAIAAVEEVRDGIERFLH